VEANDMNQMNNKTLHPAMRLPKQVAPISRQAAGTSPQHQINASGIACSLCKMACSHLSGLKQQLCLLACDHTVC
jgi:hypothetical protein